MATDAPSALAQTIELLKTDYTKSFDEKLKIIRTANTVLMMTTKFWGVEFTNGREINTDPMICCRVVTLKSRTGKTDIEQVMIMRFKTNIQPDGSFYLEMTGHQLLPVSECAKNLFLHDILGDNECLSMVNLFNRGKHEHNKYLFCPLADSLDYDVTEFIKNGSKPLISK